MTTAADRELVQLGRVQSARCAHGFSAGINCPECHPELTELTELDDPHVLLCALCESVGHSARFCSQTEAGRRRLMAVVGELEAVG